MNKKPTVQVKLLDPRATIPSRGSVDAAGWDLHALEGGYIHHGQRIVVDTGIALAIPKGFEGQIRPRSGLAAKYGVTVINTPGTIDSDYRGPVKIALINHGQDYSWPAGARLAQIVFQRVPSVELELVEELDETDRGAGGFGSTGK